MDGDFALVYGDGTEDLITIACPEGKKELRVSFNPAWETGYTKADGTVFNGPFDKAIVTFDDKAFEGVQDTSVKDGTVYVVKADADSVTAVMLATNAAISLTSDVEQIRDGMPDTGGAFDMFATTCAQINGLK